MNVINFLISLVYGIVEGITEWLPVSSTGHLILARAILPLKGQDAEFFEFYEVVIQLGAILAVVLIFWKQLWPFANGSLDGTKKGICLKKDIFDMWIKIIAACLPAAVIGLVFDDVFNELFYNPVSVSIALIVVGVIFFITEIINKKESTINDISEITMKTALIIGVFQVIAAVFPGVSRSGATIIGALLIGVSRKTAAEFTFFLAIPVMAGASLLKLIKFGLDFSAEQLIIVAIGFVSAFIISIFIIKFLLSYIKKHDFKVFAVYRVIIGIVFLVLCLMDIVDMSLFAV